LYSSHERSSELVPKTGNKESVNGKQTVLQAEIPRNRGSILVRCKGLCVLRSPDRPMDPPSLQSSREREVDHSLLPKAVVKNEYVFLE